MSSLTFFPRLVVYGGPRDVLGMLETLEIIFNRWTITWAFISRRWETRVRRKRGGREDERMEGEKKEGGGREGEEVG